MNLFRQIIDTTSVLENLVTRFLRRFHGMWFIGLLAACGCNPDTGSISGTVMYKGKEVPSGTVSFFTQGKVFETDIQEGNYQIKAVPLGEARIIVIRLDPALPDPREPLNQARKRSADNQISQMDPAIVSDPIRLEALQKKRHLLPVIYSSPNTSDLRYTVIAGTNTFDIQLQEIPSFK